MPGSFTAAVTPIQFPEESGSQSQIDYSEDSVRSKGVGYRPPSFSIEFSGRPGRMKYWPSRANAYSVQRRPEFITINYAGRDRARSPGKAPWNILISHRIAGYEQ